MILLFYDDEKLQEEQDRQNVCQDRNVLCLAGERGDDGVGDERHADAVADRACDGHEDEHERNGDNLENIVPVDLLEAAYHEDADIDQSCTRCRSGDQSRDGGDEHAQQEHYSGRQRGKAGAAARLDAGTGLDEGRYGGGAGACACDGADGVREQSFLHLGHLAVLIEHVRACGGADEGSDGVEHIDHAEGDYKRDGREPADAYECLKIKLEEGGVEHIAERGNKGCGGERLKRIRVEENEAAAPVDDAGDEHAEDDGCLTYIDSFMKRTPGLDYLLNWREANELKN